MFTIFVLLSKSHVKFRLEVFELKTKMAQFAIKIIIYESDVVNFGKHIFSVNHLIP